jgi:hypothetical protein
VLRQDPDADLPGCNADDEGENDRSLTASDIKPDRSTGAHCQIECQLIQLWAQAAPPPIIVPQVTPQFNNPGPQVKIPQPGNPLQQRTIGTGSQIVPGRSVESLRRHGHHAAKHRHLSRNHPSTKQHNQGASSQEPSDKQQRPKTSRASQEQEHIPADEKLKQLDDALGKKLKGICRGC